MTRLRLGAVEYLNARPLVFGLERSDRFDLRFDVPSRCAELLHSNEIDVGLIPSIEYLRGVYHVAPDLAIASRGDVASVALYTTRPIGDVRSIAMDTSSRTSVALVRVLCGRAFRIKPVLEPRGPDLDAMLASCDAALLIGDNALFSAHNEIGPKGGPDRAFGGVDKIDLGNEWTKLTGLPFVWAFWAGRSDALTPKDVRALQEARNAGIKEMPAISCTYFPASPERQAVAARYLRDNIKYTLGADERAGLELFYQYAAEAGIVEAVQPLRFFRQN